jgi:hypothetical protein
MTATRFSLRAVLAAAVVLNVSATARAQGKVEDERDRPHDLILAVDVSLSMIMKYPDQDRNVHAPNDPDGIRWDGVQFTIDVAGDHDRIALVLYRAENVIVTKAIDPTGFVRLAADYDWTDPQTGRIAKRKGRDLLTELVAQVQAREKGWAEEIAKRQAGNDNPLEKEYRDYEIQLLKGRPQAKTDLAHGTASLLALKTIQRELLPGLRKSEARAWVFLFTDGEEERPATPGPQYPLSAYDYIGQRKGLKGAKLRAWVDPWTKAFREGKVPVFTFALGTTCDLELLQSISLSSGPVGQHAGQAASYNPRTNLALLEDLQQLQWELREYWKRPLGPERRDATQEIFATPDVQIWRDLGLLLYRLPSGVPARAARALAPLPQHMKTPPRVGNRPLPELAPRRSRSHWYYSYPPPELPGAPLAGQLRLVVNKDGPPREAYTSQCVLALRTREPLFQYQEPAAGKKYTPRDAIPFRVDFTPYAVQGRAGKDVPFEAEDFEVKVTLTPAYRVGPTTPTAQTFALDRDAPDPGAPLAVRRFSKEVVLDSAPASPGKPSLSGLYFVDVEIAGIQDPKKGLENPLRGAVRRLIRRTLEVGPYPAVKISPAEVTLTTDRAGGTASEIKVELDMVTDPKQVETRLAVTVQRGPGLGKTIIDPSRFELSPQPLTLRGRSGTFRVALPAKGWSGLPAGDYSAGRLAVQAPWQTAATAAELAARKKAYKLLVAPLVRLDLGGSGKDATSRDIAVGLDTDLAAEETVWLSASATPAQEEPAELRFKQIEDDRGAPLKKGKDVVFQIGGLGRANAAAATGADGSQKGRLSFTLKHAGPPPAGVYQTTLYVVGPSVKAVPVTINVAANQVSICDRAGKPLDEVYLLGLAGTDVKQTLTFRSSLPSRPVRAVAVRPNWPALQNLPPTGWDRLPLDVKETADQQLTLVVHVPACVQEGKYSTEVTFEVTTAADQGTQRMQISLPVYVEVRHTGVRFRHQDLDLKGILWLSFPEDKATGEVASRNLDLITDAEKAPVRWSVERIKPKDGPGTALDPGDARLDLLFKGRLVLAPSGVKSKGGKEDLEAGGPRDPIRADKPATLTVRVSRQGLDPGLYRGVLRFHSREDRPEADKGLVNDLEVRVVVPGRDFKATKAGPSPYLGGEAELQIELTCYDCPPDKGQVQALDEAGKPAGPVVTLAVPARSEEVPSIPGAMRYYYGVKVTPPRVGKNVYEVRWPRFREGEGPADQKTLARRVTAEALGVIEVKRRVVGVNEELTIRAKVDSSAMEAGAPLLLHLRNRAERDAEAIPLELFDDGKADHGDERAGDGIYSARHRFPGAGVWDVVFPGEGSPGPLKAEVVRVDYELHAADRLATIEYGDDGWLGWLGIRAEVSDPKMVQLKNTRTERCEWRARLRFTEGGPDPQQLKEAAVLALPTTPDPRRHLDVHVTGPGTAKDGWALGGTLLQNEEAELGIEGKLSQPALDELAGKAAEGATPHPTLGKTSTVVLELELEWFDDQGQSVGKRTVLAPFSIATRRWTANPKVWILGGAALVVLFVLLRALLRLGKGRPRLAPVATEQAPPAAVKTVAPAQPAKEPAPRPAPPRYSGPDDVPEHLR